MEDERKKKILQTIHCFKSPVHHSLVYVYSQTYTQDTDVYNYALHSGKNSLFSSKELHFLKVEKRPAHLGIIILQKVLRICCSPSLASHDDPLWSSKEIQPFENCSSTNKIEEIITSLISWYRYFLNTASKLSPSHMDNLMENLNHNVCILIERAAQFLNQTRWKEENDKINKMFSDIKSANLKQCKRSISDIIQVEAEFRTDLYDELLLKELGLIEQLPWHLEPFTCNKNGEIEMKDYEVKEQIKAEAIFQNISDKQICWIAGEHGAGKSSFASFIASSWTWKGNQIANLSNFRSVFVISLTEMQCVDLEKDGSIFRLILPLTSLLVDQASLELWLKEENILIVFDDVTKHSEQIVQKVYSTVRDKPNLMVWFLGRLSAVIKYTKNPTYSKEAVLLELKGFTDEYLLALSKEIDDNAEINLREQLKTNMNRLASVLKYPTIAHWTCQLWKESPHLLKNIYTSSDLMWEILAFKVRQILKINIKKMGSVRKKFLSWVMLAGELALYSLKADFRVDKESLEELETEIVSLYKENGRKLMDALFKPTITHSFATCFTCAASTSKPFLEYLSSWFFVDQLLSNKHMSQLTNGLVNQLPLILFAAGHMERFQDEGSVSVPEERKVIKALINYREDSYEDFAFIQKFVAELKCIKRLVELVIDETEYNEEWNINVAEVQQKSLEVLLNHVSPTRLIFLADESKKNYELTSVMNYVCRVNISLWLDSVPQFSYGNKQKLDKLLKPFLGECVATRVDLISGCLSTSVMKELHKAAATRHLVLLRLNVSDEIKLNIALSLPKILPHLLWLEVKLDMNVKDLELANIQATDVELFDAHMRGIDDKDVTFVGDLLSAMHTLYTGIHLEETKMTPEGVFSFLKDLCKKQVSLRAKDESINKFRRWYYPALSSLPKWKTLSEEESLELIGHDDRDFFSDHHVTSSQFVTALDAWNLRNYLENQKNIIHFVYEANNIRFTKIVDGSVDIAFKGDYREIIKDKVFNKVDGDSVEVESEVMNLY